MSPGAPNLLPAVAEHHWAGPLLLLNASKPPPTTLPKPIYPPHLKKVIKWKGRSYLFLSCASPELSNSQIKSRKRLMKDGGESRGCAGSGMGLGGGCRADPGAGAGFEGGRWSPIALPGQGLVVAVAQKATRVLPRSSFGKSKAEAAGGLPGKYLMSANSDFHIQQGCPATGTALVGTAAASAACASPAQECNIRRGRIFFNRAPWRHQSNFQGGLKPLGSLLDLFCRVNLMLVISEQVKQLRSWWLLKALAV